AHNTRQRGDKIIKEDLAASFQASVVDVLTEKTYRAALEHKVKQVIVAGGVAANKGLRTSLEKRFEETDIPLLIPPFHLCTDNAAMIDAPSSILFEHQEFSS